MARATRTAYRARRSPSESRRHGPKAARATATKAATAGELSSLRQTRQVSSESVGSLIATATIPSGSPPATVCGAMAAAGISARTPRSQPVWNDSFRTRGSKPARRKIAMNASCSRGAISRGNTTKSSSASAESGIASSCASGWPRAGARPCAPCGSGQAPARRRSRGRGRGRCRCCRWRTPEASARSTSPARGARRPGGVPGTRGRAPGASRSGCSTNRRSAAVRARRPPRAWRPRPPVRHPPASAAPLRGTRARRR